MRTLRIIIVLALFVSCNKEDDCECLNLIKNEKQYNIKVCSPELKESLITREGSPDKWWKQFQHESPCN